MTVTSSRFVRFLKFLVLKKATSSLQKTCISDPCYNGYFELLQSCGWVTFSVTVCQIQLNIWHTTRLSLSNQQEIALLGCLLVILCNSCRKRKHSCHDCWSQTISNHQCRHVVIPVLSLRTALAEAWHCSIVNNALARITLSSRPWKMYGQFRCRSANIAGCYTFPHYSLPPRQNRSTVTVVGSSRLSL